MFQFIETIKIDKGQIYRIAYHQARFEATRDAFFQNEIMPSIDLESRIVPPDNKHCYRCRITYGKFIDKIEYFPYEPKPIETLKVIEADELFYYYKFADRAKIDALTEQKGAADDILMVRNGLFTDTSIANVAFLKDDVWHTPQFPLLAGTQREELLHLQKVVIKKVALKDLFDYSHIAIFNAMIEFGDLVLPINKETIILPEKE